MCHPAYRIGSLENFSENVRFPQRGRCAENLQSFGARGTPFSLSRALVRGSLVTQGEILLKVTWRTPSFRRNLPITRTKSAYRLLQREKL